MAAEPAVLRALRQRAETDLTAAIDELCARLVALHPQASPLAHHLASFVRAGGKRLRPVCVLLGWATAAPGTSLEPAVGPAVATELLHTCALVHDDLIDAAPTRRGQPTVHLALQEEHRRAGWHGDGRRFGEAGALLLGDLAHVEADEQFLRALDAGVPADRWREAFRRFDRVREELTVGQYLDVAATYQRGATPELALVIARLKSGRYSVAGPLEIGAILGGGTPELLTALSAAGDLLGQAFQLRDDVLGVFGTSEVTGKSTSSDLSEGKRTLLVAETSARLDGRDRERFLDLLGRADLDERQAEELRDAMRRSGGLAAVEAHVDDLAGRADQALDRLPVDREVAAPLRELAAYLTSRGA